MYKIVQYICIAGNSPKKKKKKTFSDKQQIMKTTKVMSLEYFLLYGIYYGISYLL